jgi:hypothetical protein
MALVHFSFEHGSTLVEAQSRLGEAVEIVQHQAQPLLQAVEWSDSGTRALLVGRGFEVQIHVDDHAVYVVGDIPSWIKLLVNSPLIMLQKALERTFQNRLDIK